jgi:hypothetical protein
MRLTQLPVHRSLLVCIRRFRGSRMSIFGRVRPCEFPLPISDVKRAALRLSVSVINGVPLTATDGDHRNDDRPRAILRISRSMYSRVQSGLTGSNVGFHARNGAYIPGVHPGIAPTAPVGRFRACWRLSTLVARDGGEPAAAGTGRHPRSIKRLGKARIALRSYN